MATTEKKKKLYYEYLKQFRELDRAKYYGSRHSYKIARKDFGNLLSQAKIAFEYPPEQLKQIIPAADLLYLKYLILSKERAKQKADAAKILREQKIQESGPMYNEFRKRLDDLKYEYFEKGCYIGRTPKAYTEFKEKKTDNYYTYKPEEQKNTDFGLFLSNHLTNFALSTYLKLFLTFYSNI